MCLNGRWQPRHRQTRLSNVYKGTFTGLPRPISPPQRNRFVCKLECLYQDLTVGLYILLLDETHVLWSLMLKAASHRAESASLWAQG